jgi:hypothetical protein
MIADPKRQALPGASNLLFFTQISVTVSDETRPGFLVVSRNQPGLTLIFIYGNMASSLPRQWGAERSFCSTTGGFP